jgi:hypothetical protein
VGAVSPGTSGGAHSGETTHTHTVNNGKRDLTIDELAAAQPGLDRLMAELGPRMHRLYYAAQARNWRLADYYYKSIVKHLKLCAFSRPKYAEPIGTYLAEDCPMVAAAIRAADSRAFEQAYAAMVKRANDYHDDWGKPYVHWVCPSSPPSDLDLSAGVD